MNEIIKIKEHNGQRLVNARELHEFLGSKQEFSNWMRNRIEKYGFIENQDYTSFDKIIKREKGASTRVEYALTIDMAKELSMVENNDKGREARQYFIRAEKKLKEATQHSLPGSFAEALRLAAQQAEELERKEQRLKLQQQVITESKPKVQYHDEVLQSQSVYTTTQIAKELGMGAPTLNRKLKQLGVQYKQGGVWLLYHKYQNKGYTKTRTYTYTDNENETKTSMQTVWTEAGRKFIHDKLRV